MWNEGDLQAGGNILLKDEEARAVINLLSKRTNQLEREIELLKEPHPKDCKCDQCIGFAKRSCAR